MNSEHLKTGERHVISGRLVTSEHLKTCERHVISGRLVTSKHLKTCERHSRLIARHDSRRHHNSQGLVGLAIASRALGVLPARVYWIRWP